MKIRSLFGRLVLGVFGGAVLAVSALAGGMVDLDDYSAYRLDLGIEAPSAESGDSSEESERRLLPSRRF